MPAYPRQNALARALREIGCLERTLFILDWISDPALRRRSNAGLDGTKLRAIWDGSRPERAVGIQPEPRHSLCYIAHGSVERSLEMLPEGSSARPQPPRDGVSVA